MRVQPPDRPLATGLSAQAGAEIEKALCAFWENESRALLRTTGLFIDLPFGIAVLEGQFPPTGNMSFSGDASGLYRWLLTGLGRSIDPQFALAIDALEPIPTDNWEALPLEIAKSCAVFSPDSILTIFDDYTAVISSGINAWLWLKGASPTRQADCLCGNMLQALKFLQEGAEINFSHTGLWLRNGKWAIHLANAVPATSSALHLIACLEDPLIPTAHIEIPEAEQVALPQIMVRATNGRVVALGGIQDLNLNARCRTEEPWGLRFQPGNILSCFRAGSEVAIHKSKGSNLPSAVRMGNAWLFVPPR